MGEKALIEEAGTKSFSGENSVVLGIQVKGCVWLESKAVSVEWLGWGRESREVRLAPRKEAYQQPPVSSILLVKKKKKKKKSLNVQWVHDFPE